MNHLYLIIEIVVAFALLLAAKKFFGKSGVLAWIALATVFANIFEAKNIDLFGLNLAAGHVMFGSVFLATDMLSEYYGKKAAKTGVLVGLSADCYNADLPPLYPVCGRYGRPGDTKIIHYEFEDHGGQRGYVLYLQLVRCPAVRKDPGTDRREISLAA